MLPVQGLVRYDVVPKMEASEIRTKRFDFPFMVADTEWGPRITWGHYSLDLEFVDFLGGNCHVRFSDVSHYELVSEDEMDPNAYRYDGVVEVVGSSLISRLVEIGEIDSSEVGEFRHLVIGFNEIGSYVVVVFRTLETIEAQQGSDPNPVV